MECPRCAGLMSYERFLCRGSDRFPVEYEGLRCLCCGEIIDPVILLNRSAAEVHGRTPVSGHMPTALHACAMLTGRHS